MALCALPLLNSIGNLRVVTHSVFLELLVGNSIFDKSSLESIAFFSFNNL